jgi:hypothetical protein
MRNRLLEIRYGAPLARLLWQAHVGETRSWQAAATRHGRCSRDDLPAITKQTVTERHAPRGAMAASSGTGAITRQAVL